MSLKDILEKIIAQKMPIILCDRQKKDWKPEELLTVLTPPQLTRQAYLQPGMYIAEINDGGFLGAVLYTVKAI